MSDGEEPENAPQPRKRKSTGKRKKAKGKGKPKSIRQIKEIASAAPSSTRARARDWDKRDAELPSLEDLQRAVRIEQLLERLATEGEEITVAARACKIDRKTLWRWRRDIDGLDDQLAEAYREGTDSLVEVARCRGKDGWLEPIYQGGEKVGEKRLYDSSLLQMIIRKREPAFRDPKYAVPVTAPKLAGEVTLDLDAMPADLLALLEAEARRQQAEKQKAPAL